MSKGQTVPCPHCKEILLRYAVFTGEGTFETLCPHCKKMVSVTMGQKCWITTCAIKTLIAFFILFSLFAVQFIDISDNSITTNVPFDLIED